MTQNCKASKGVMEAPRSGGATWEHEDTMRTKYPFLFENEGTWFSHLAFK